MQCLHSVRIRGGSCSGISLQSATSCIARRRLPLSDAPRPHVVREALLAKQLLQLRRRRGCPVLLRVGAGALVSARADCVSVSAAVGRASLAESASQGAPRVRYQPIIPRVARRSVRCGARCAIVAHACPTADAALARAVRRLWQVKGARTHRCTRVMPVHGPHRCAPSDGASAPANATRRRTPLSPCDAASARPPTHRI
jgi:hypothetical protein